MRCYDCEFGICGNCFFSLCRLTEVGGIKALVVGNCVRIMLLEKWRDVIMLLETKVHVRQFGWNITSLAGILQVWVEYYKFGWIITGVREVVEAGLGIVISFVDFCGVYYC